MTGGDAEGSGAVPHWRVAIIGAGAGGLGLAIRLVKARQRDFVIFEASDGVGGTWRANTYPGAACDVPSHLYSYSFALKPDWSKTYAEQPEILQYFEDCADRFGIRPHLRPHTRITSARWDEGARPLASHRRRRRHLRRRRAGQRHRDLHHPVHPGHRRPGVVCRTVLPLGPLGARARPRRQAGGRHRDGCQCRADRARGGQGRGHRRRLPAHAAMDPAPLRQALHRGGEAPLRAQPDRHPPPPPRHLLGLREHDRLPPRRRDGRAAQGAGAQPH